MKNARLSLTDGIMDIKFSVQESNENDGFSTGLVKIRISIPNSQNKSDVVSYVAKVLHANRIELVNAFFSQEKIIIIILNERYSSRAYDILHSDIIRKLMILGEIIL